MKKLKTAVRVADLDTVSDVLVALFKENTDLAQDAFLKNVMENIEVLSARITTAIKADKTVSKLEEIDGQRDEILSSIGKMLVGFSAIPVEELREAANRLLPVWNKYRGIAKENYEAESSHIESLLEDMGRSEMSSSVGKITGLSQQLAALRAAQDEFNVAYRSLLNANTDKGASATSIKKPLVAAINEDLVPYLTMMVRVNAGLYGRFASNVEREIDKANALIGKRGNAAGE